MKRKTIALMCGAFLAFAIGHANTSAGVPASAPSRATRAKSQQAKSNGPVSGAARPRPQAPTGTPGAAATSRGDLLPDTAVLARVDDRLIRVHDFNDAYFNGDPQYRPRPDSLGRVELLNSMIDKEIVALTAIALNPPLSFEDRATLRDHTNRVISNVLYARMVIDSVNVTERDILQVYEQFKTEIRLKHIQFADRATAERVRRELLAKRVPWSVAVRKYSTAEDRVRDGDTGWRTRLGMDPQLAASVWDLKLGEVSDVIEEDQGFHVAMVSERRPAVAPALEPLRRTIRDQIVGVRATERQHHIQQELLSHQNVVYDDANITWAAARFQKAVSFSSDGRSPVLDINPNLPDIPAPDHERVLARYKGGSVTLDQLMQAYQSISPMLRPALDSPAALKGQVAGVILEPVMVQLAHDRGIDKDPEAVTLIEKKREELMVEHLFQDSIQAHVRITPQMRRKYYEDHKAGFFTYPKVRFAALTSHSRAGADSLKARLAGGEKVESILLADSLAGIRRGSIQERYQNEHGPYHKVLFEELRPGQVTVDGPDKQGDYIILQLLAFDAGHQLKYEEVERVVDESVQNTAADAMFKAFIARHRRSHKVESHPELVMRFLVANPN